MDWLEGEPKLEEMLSDPVIRAMMQRDDIDLDGLRLFLGDMRNTLRERADRETWHTRAAVARRLQERS